MDPSLLQPPVYSSFRFSLYDSRRGARMGVTCTRRPYGFYLTPTPRLEWLGRWVLRGEGPVAVWGEWADRADPELLRAAVALVEGGLGSAGDAINRAGARTYDVSSRFSLTAISIDLEYESDENS